MRGKRSCSLIEDWAEYEDICGQGHILMNLSCYKCHAIVLFLIKYSSDIAILSFLVVKRI